MTTVLLICAIIFLSYRSFHFEKFSRLERIVIPVYSMIMFFVTVKWDDVSMVVAPIIVLLSYVIVEYQLISVETRISKELDRRGNPVVEVKQGKNFAIGWIAILALGTLLNMLFSEGFDREHLLEGLVHEVRNELLTILFLRLKQSGLFGFYRGQVVFTTPIDF